MIADQHEPPVLLFGEVDEAGKGRGADHAGFVHEHGRVGGELVAIAGWAVGAVPLVQELGEPVGWDAGLAFEHAGGLRRGGHTEHAAVVFGEVVDRGPEHRGLTGTGRAAAQRCPRRTPGSWSPASSPCSDPLGNCLSNSGGQRRGGSHR